MATDKLVNFDHVTDYISREAAEAAMTALRQEDIEAFGIEIPECFPSGSAIGALNKIPAADVRPIVHGRWLMKDHKMMGKTPCCSECGKFEPMKRNFCPNCGADCRGGNDGK